MGEIVSEWRDDPDHLSVPSSIAINADDALAVLDVPSQEITIFDPGGSEPERYPIDVLYFHPTLGTYGEMFFGADNDIWYIDANEASPYSLRRLDLETGAIEPFTSDVVVDPSSQFVFGPAGGVVGDDGLLYLAMDSNGTVRSFSPDGEMIDTWPAGDDHPVEQAIDVALGPDGVYILWSGRIDENAGYFVSRFGDDPADPVGFITPPDVTGESADAIPGHPLAMAVGPDGLIYLLDPFANDVIVLDGDGDLVSRWNTGSTTTLTLFDIAVDPDGNIYLSDTLQRSVLVFAPAG